MPEADGVFQGAQINEELVSETGVLEMWVISMQLLSDPSTFGCYDIL